MTTELVTLRADVDVFDAIDHLLSKRISGAPVLADNGNFEGIFSEKTAMKVLISAAYDQLPGTNVGAYMNIDRNRIVCENASVLEIAHKFQETPYRRLPVLNRESLAGQISRRDVLREEHRIAKQVVKLAASEGCDQRLCESEIHADVGSFMDEHAKTIHPGEDLLNIAQIFLNSPYRRLPVVDRNRLVGQVSRRDLLGAAADLLRQTTFRRQPATLYFSGLVESMPPSI
jgi:CBS domain-containing protein